jgi:hypothetical protein
MQVATLSKDTIDTLSRYQIPKMNGKTELSTGGRVKLWVQSLYDDSAALQRQRKKDHQVATQLKLARQDSDFESAAKILQTQRFRGWESLNEALQTFFIASRQCTAPKTRVSIQLQTAKLLKRVVYSNELAVQLLGQSKFEEFIVSTRIGPNIYRQCVSALVTTKLAQECLSRVEKRFQHMVLYPSAVLDTEVCKELRAGPSLYRVAACQRFTQNVLKLLAAETSTVKPSFDQIFTEADQRSSQQTAELHAVNAALSTRKTPIPRPRGF